MPRLSQHVRGPWNSTPDAEKNRHWPGGGSAGGRRSVRLRVRVPSTAVGSGRASCPATTTRRLKPTEPGSASWPRRKPPPRRSTGAAAAVPEGPFAGARARMRRRAWPRPVRSAPAAVDARRARGYWPDFRGPLRRRAATPKHRSAPPGRKRACRSSGSSHRRRLRVVCRRRRSCIHRSSSVARGKWCGLRRRTGREIWTHGWDGEFRESMGGDGPRATPTYHEGASYALGALGEFHCLDARTGALVWRRNILADNDARISAGACRHRRSSSTTR